MSIKKNSGSVPENTNRQAVYTAEELEAMPAEDFAFVQDDSELHDQKFETKPVGYFMDAMSRFVKNRSSVIGFAVIVVLLLFAVIVPFISRYDMNDRDVNYAFALPKSELFAKLGIWDGCSTSTVNQQTYDKYEAIPGALVKVISKTETSGSRRGGSNSEYKIKIDSYAKVGYIYDTISVSAYEQAREYELETGIQLFYPLIDDEQVNAIAYRNDANAWYLTDEKGIAQRTADGSLQDIYLRDDNGDPVYCRYTSSGSQVYVRILYSEWYRYQNGYYASFLFGADASGYDIMTRLANGARLSIILSIIVSFFDLFFGVIIGALEGYYGGKVDLIVERIKDFLWEVPDMVIFSLFQLYCADKVGPVFSLFFAFVFFGWIGTSSTVRAQMYRYKGQEYVLAARTLGAKDRRLIFRHILPNGIGYIITSSVLAIPGVILSEASMSYLGIVNLQSDSMTSIGTMLNNGQSTLSTYPHCVFFPAVFIALLLISFNQFGNGLRDAFNPALRGSEN